MAFERAIGPEPGQARNGFARLSSPRPGGPLPRAARKPRGAALRYAAALRLRLRVLAHPVPGRVIATKAAMGAAAIPRPL